MNAGVRPARHGQIPCPRRCWRKTCVSPISLRLPKRFRPKLYGGTERVIWWLTEALVALGHDVTLFASGDSTTSAQARRLLRNRRSGWTASTTTPHSLLAMLDRVVRGADRFDVLHFHIDFLHFPTFRHLAHKCLTTLHGRQDLPDFWPAYQAFPEMKLVSISDNQRLPIADAELHRHGASRHAAEPDRPGSAQGDYLAFVGRISPEKRPDRAIEIAKRAGLKLKIAAKVDHVDAQSISRDHIEPLIDDPSIEFVGEIGDADKPAFLGDALRPAVPGRLARAVRPGHDRGDGGGNARSSPGAQRLRAGSRSTMAAAASSSTLSIEAVAAVEAARSLPRATEFAPASSSASPPTAWRGTICACTSCSAAPGGFPLWRLDDHGRLIGMNEIIASTGWAGAEPQSRPEDLSYRGDQFARRPDAADPQA